MSVETRQILLTCVHYNDTRAVASFCEQVTALALPPGWALDIAIADNSMNWPSDTALPANAHVIQPFGNQGYLSGCAAAHESWITAGAAQPDWTGICNTDLLFDPLFFMDLFHQEIPDDTGVLAPYVYCPDGTPQNPFLHNRPSPRRIYAYTLIYRSLLLTTVLQQLHGVKCFWKRLRQRRVCSPAPSTFTPAAAAHPFAQRIYAPHGSLFFLSAAFFNQGGTLRYPGFLYGEELFIAEQARRYKLQVAWMPQARVRHDAHASTGGVARRRKLGMMLESARIAWRNDFSSL